MEFNKDLFLLLCEKYGVELSKTAKTPMIKKGNQLHPIIEDDLKRIFTISLKDK